MSNSIPTDALRLEAAKIIDPAAFLFKTDELMKGDASQYDALRKAERILALAAPASPMPEGGGDMDWQSVAMWMGFSASVIKSGEPWTDQCQQHYDEAKAAFARLAAPTGAK